MKIIIIGSVAAGTSLAAKARRNNEDAEIVVYDQDKQISYSICGIPYYLGGEVDSLDRLTPRTPKWFKERYNVSIFTEHQVTSVDPDNKRISVTNLQTGEIAIDVYDELVLATGARPVIPEIFMESEKTQNVFSVRNITNASDIHRYIMTNNPQNVTIVGAGFIGLEVAEQLVKKGLNVTIVQRGAHVMSQMDAEMAYRVKLELEKNKVQLQLNASISELDIENQKVVGLYTNQGVKIETDLVIITTGVAPNTDLVQSVPVVLGTSGAIKVDPFMQTSVPHIYAVGDVAESFSVLTGKAIYRPLGSTANKMGRIAGDVITGGDSKHRGILGTGILRVFGITVAFTGLTEKEALAEGYELAVLYNIKPDHGDYLGGKEMTIKALADKKSGKILGAQIIGEQGVDKRIDVLATAISFGAIAEDLFHLDLAYAPPFSTTKDPIIYTGMALDNAVNQARELITPQDLIKRQKNGEMLQIIDTRSKAQFDRSKVEGARHMPLKMLRSTLGELDKERVTIVYCNKGVTGNAAQNILLNNGFRTVYNLSGGNKNYQITLEMMRSDSF